uniref:Uncharacterized protein n=1 Tax=Romanomermis culicivorax TaxID=13658 RepID=A0A915I2G3_ROMCU
MLTIEVQRLWENGRRKENSRKMTEKEKPNYNFTIKRILIFTVSEETVKYFHCNTKGGVVM